MKRVLSLVLVAGVASSLGHFLRGPMPVGGAAGGGGGKGAQADEYFVCADSNGDGFVNVADPVYTLRYLFSEAPVPRCEAAPRGSPPATGQTECYDNAGNVIDCASADFPGQDGFYQAGCPMESRFVDNGDGTVTDNCTGLMWEKQPNILDTWWQGALEYCESLSLAGHGDWRLPNVRELASIVDYGRFHPAIDPVFQAGADWYWSSTSYVINSSAWSVHFFYGGVGVDTKTNVGYVRAVRNAP